ncbi:hypothetical protein EDB86DRAFT_3080340 [Lactarius hatsudake]|nr:hypothetical protein EDB86DRAFT_3080340 [Lactarius hatsudake]
MASTGGQRGGSRTRSEDVKRFRMLPSLDGLPKSDRSYKRSTELARKADTLILKDSHAIQRAGAGSVDEKKNAVDLVTEYDVKVEELVRREIAGAYRHF